MRHNDERGEKKRNDVRRHVVVYIRRSPRCTSRAHEMTRRHAHDSREIDVASTRVHASIKEIVGGGESDERVRYGYVVGRIRFDFPIR